jgi:hypothetical protein
VIDVTGFALAVLLIELTPGPNMAWIVTLTLAEGRRAGLGAIPAPLRPSCPRAQGVSVTPLPGS